VRAPSRPSQYVPDPATIDALHHVYQALRAHTLLKLRRLCPTHTAKSSSSMNFTGTRCPPAAGLTAAPGRRAKEGVNERRIRRLRDHHLPNYFALYKKLSATFTAETEAAEIR